MTPENGKPELKTRKEKIQWFLDEIDSYKEDMGKWYTVLFRRILPIILFIMPLFAECKFFYQFVADRYLSGIFSSNDLTPVYVLWPISILFFTVILIFLPRFGTFCEFILGPFYILLAFKMSYINTAFGYFTIISVSVFMFMKLVFLIFEIMYRIVFRGEKAPKVYQGDDDIVFQEIFKKISKTLAFTVIKCYNSNDE